MSKKAPAKSGGQAKKPAAAAEPAAAEGDAPHAVFEFALSLLNKSKSGEYQLYPPAAQKLRSALLDLQGRPDFKRAVKDVAMLAHMLETKHKSPAAALALLEETEAAVSISQGKPVRKRA